MFRSNGIQRTIHVGLIDKAHAVRSTVPIMGKVHLVIGLGPDDVNRTAIGFRNIHPDTIVGDDDILLRRRRRLGQGWKRQQEEQD
jgi:hypothetical protein